LLNISIESFVHINARRWQILYTYLERVGEHVDTLNQIIIFILLSVIYKSHFIRFNIYLQMFVIYWLLHMRIILFSTYLYMYLIGNIFSYYVGFSNGLWMLLMIFNKLLYSKCEYTPCWIWYGIMFYVPKKLDVKNIRTLYIDIDTTVITRE